MLCDGLYIFNVCTCYTTMILQSHCRQSIASILRNNLLVTARNYLDCVKNNLASEELVLILHRVYDVRMPPLMNIYNFGIFKKT